MRPVKRGSSPKAHDFSEYRDAFPYLVSRLGPYCSYCERRIQTMLHVEHVQPKDLPAYSGLIGRWSNFLLACVNCNSTKGDKDVVLSDVLLPDRDNTFAAYSWTPDGKIVPAAGLNPGLRQMATRTLALTGLDKKISSVHDENGKLVAIDRVGQRMQVWAIAQEALAEVQANAGNDAVKRCVVRMALAEGFFSVWMSVFSADADMRNRFIDAFTGTRWSGCFDPVTAQLKFPAPNPDGLPHGSKI